LFITTTIEKIKLTDAIVKRSLMEILQHIRRHSDSPKILTIDFNLFPFVTELAQDRSQVVLNQMANSFLKEIQADIFSAENIV